MSKHYPTKTVALDFRGETVERVVKADLDRVYVGHKGDTYVYYDAHTLVDDKHLFIRGADDNVIAEMKKYG